MQNISGYGLIVQIFASITFPAGITVTQLADDVDQFEVPSLQIVDKAMGLNGDLLVWNKAVPINLTVAVVPNGVDDINLGILLENNRVGRGKLSVGDIITMVSTNPQTGTIFTYNNGALTDGIPGLPIASAGRMKSKPYMFTFENRTLGQ